jgi:hypothetical protein
MPELKQVQQTGRNAGGDGKTLATILALAVLLRLAAILVMNALHLASASGEQWLPAWGLYRGQGFVFDWYGLLSSPQPSSFLPPLYAWVLYLALLLTGGQAPVAALAAQVFNALLGAGTACLCAQLAGMAWPNDLRGSQAASRTAASRPAARLSGLLRDPRWLAAGIWAVYPPSVAHAAVTQTQDLETFLLVLLAFLVLRALPVPRPRTAVLAGLALGGLLLSRPSAGLTWVFCALAVWQLSQRRREVCRFLVWATLAALVAALPWTVRNYRLHGRLVPVALNGGFNFYIGNGPYGGGEIPPLPSFFDRWEVSARDSLRKQSEVERDATLYRLGLETIRHDPGGELKKLWRRAVSFVLFRPYLFAAYPGWIAALFVLSYLAVLVPFLLALPRCRGPAAGFFLAAIVATGLVGLVYIVSMRFRATVEPFMVVIAAGWISRRWGRQPESVPAQRT